MTSKIVTALFAGALFCSPAAAQSNGASVSVQAGPLRGDANAGQTEADRTAQNRAPAIGQRNVPQNQHCDRVTVRSQDGAASASASVSASGGGTALAAGGSPNARTEFSDCTQTHPQTREASSGRGGR
jgi:hypothetical protein